MSASARKLFYYFHWPLFAVVLFLMAAGLLNLYSASSTGAGDASHFFRSQMLFAFLGLGLMASMMTFHYRHLLAWALPVYLGAMVLLAAVVVFGKTMGGQKNWLVYGWFRLQPSELAKIAVILMLSRYFYRHAKPEGFSLKDLFVPLGILALPMALILAVKDVGSALFFALIGLSYFFLVGVRLRWLLVALLLGAGVAAFGYGYFLSDYQRARIETFMNPEIDPRGRGYHLIQSKIAVGSGRVLGKGFLQGDLNKLKFLPERHTDFVFPVLAEEWGFAGTTVVLFAFGILFLSLLQGAGKVKDGFGAYLILGVSAWLFWQMAINLGGVLGIIPLAGVTLPFFSYGGSAYLSSMLGLGMAMNVYMRRYMF